MIGEYTPLLITLAGTGLLGLTASLLGVFAVLRGQSLLGDAISHAALPGIALTFYITQSSDPFLLTLGGGCAGICGALCARSIGAYTRLRYDALLAIILSVFFGCGVMLLTVIQKYAFADQAILGKFLFGNAATLLLYDIEMLAAIAMCICGITIMLWKELKLLVFDNQFAYSCGYATYLLDIILTILLVGTIVVGLHLVGVLLMSSLLIAPAAAARQWTSRVETMALCAGVIGVLSSVVGTSMSSLAPQVPTGPVIVVVLSVCVGVSLLFAPRRGVVWDIFRRNQIGR